MKRYIRPKNSRKPVMTAAQKRGYDMAMQIAKKHPKAMEILGR